MHLLNLLPNRGALALAVMLTLALNTRAITTDSEPRPPHYPDAAHVFNGCHLSTVAYLAQFKARFANENGKPLVVNLPNAGGTRRFHTVAVITWQGEWWCRDEYFGVYPLGLEVSTSVSQERLASCVARVLSKNGQARMKQRGFVPPPMAPENLSVEQLRREATVAAQMIPFPATTYWVRSGGREIPLVFFRPADGQVAVYHPNHGTCVAECSSTNDAGVVKAVAAQFGYKVDGLRADLGNLRGTLVAANLSVTGGAQ